MNLPNQNNKSGNNSQKQNEKNYFSRENFKNRNTKRVLGFEYWKGMLKVSISEEIPAQSQGSYPKYNELIYLHLSPLKARILLHEIKHGLLQDTTCNTNLAWGVDTGLDGKKSIIAFSHASGSTISSPIYQCTIGKPDSNFNLTSKDAYIFNSNYHFGIEWTNFSKMEFDNKFYDALEIESFCGVLEEYIKASTGAIAYSILDMGRFDYSRINTKLDVIMDKLGIPKYNSNEANYTSGGSTQFNKYKNNTSLNDFPMPEPITESELEEQIYS